MTIIGRGKLCNFEKGNTKDRRWILVEGVYFGIGLVAVGLVILMILLAIKMLGIDAIKAFIGLVFKVIIPAIVIILFLWSAVSKIITEYDLSFIPGYIGVGYIVYVLCMCVYMIVHRYEQNNKIVDEKTTNLSNKKKMEYKLLKTIKFIFTFAGLATAVTAIQVLFVPWYTRIDAEEEKEEAYKKGFMAGLRHRE